MEAIIYTAIFLTGIVFGSFFTLAVYRIPRKENITYVRSHCTTCNQKLSFWDLIPVLSYIFLGGKCRYCGEKIRIRYLLLEVFSGIVFLLVALTIGIENIISLIFIYLFMAGMFIIAGIDKETFEIPNSVCIYELCVAIAYVIYNVLVKESIINNIVGLLAIPIILLLINKLVLLLVKDEKKVPFRKWWFKIFSINRINVWFSNSDIINSFVVTYNGCWNIDT